ncbi:MAG: VWA domain-containing protein [Treponema sp.]|jgi:hypothetical protein|nr:VWA domain-containing protein [Treponema sp.]
MANKFFSTAIAITFLSTGLIYAQDLSIIQDDLRIEQRIDGGFHLFIRKKADISSVLITESTKDTQFLEANYAYRVSVWNEVNGNETRMLDGMELPPPNKYLLDSTPEPDTQFGTAFHFYIPYILNFGYETGRYGEIYVKDGTYFNLRAFTLPYADYSGAFQDNPYVLSITQKPLSGQPEENYMADTLQTFSGISGGARGEMRLSKGPDDIVEIIGEILQKEEQPFDLVICLDTTASMKDDIIAIREHLVDLLSKIKTRDSRVGIVLYKDYRDEYLTKTISFTKDIATLQKELNKITTGGGKDIPEAVHEALYEALKFPWSTNSRFIILIGDAPPHPRPQGRITEQMVVDTSARKNVKIYTIVLPQ